MKNVIVEWDNTIFDGKDRLLPDVSKLYTQIYSSDKKNSWSLVFEFENTPRNQGYITKGKVDFLVENAPKEMLINDLKFDFFDGPKKVGTFKIVEEEEIDFNNIIIQINNIEEKKIELKKYISSIRNKKIKYTESDLKKIINLSNEYPFLYTLILELDKSTAIEYLEKFFLKLPLEKNYVYQSNLSFFLFNLKENLGESAFDDFLNQLEKEVKDSHIFQKALDEII